MTLKMHRLSIKFALIPLLCCWQNLQAEDLIEVYELALQNDPQLQIAEANYLAAVQALPQARSGRKPQVTFNAGADRRETDTDRMVNPNNPRSITPSATTPSIQSDTVST